MILTPVSVSMLFPIAFFPLAVMLTIAVALIPCMLSPGARVGSAAKALYCVVLQVVGVAMMTAGALPALSGVLEKFITGAEQFGAQAYLYLLILFSVGGVIFLWHEQMAERVDDASRRVPTLLLWYTFKIIGALLMLFGLLSLLFTILQMQQQPGAWWITPLVTVLYGLLLSWCTKTPTESAGFRLLPLHGNSLKPAGRGKRK